MIALNSNPAYSLRELLVTQGSTSTIYINGETPSSKLPDEFIEIVPNGAISSEASQLGTGTCALLVIINVKLLSNSAANFTKENIILGLFQDLFSKAVVKSGFTFSIDKKRMVYQGKSIVSGYSTKMLNVITKF